MAGHLEVWRAVIARAAELLGSGFGGEVRRREERLRQVLVAALAERAEVTEVALEWRPHMLRWPSQGTRRLGGFDLAVRFESEESFSSAAELKWCQRTGLDAFDEVLWDTFKLAHAQATLDGVDTALLIYAAPLQAWQVDGRFRSLFDDSLAMTESLLRDHANVWRWLLESSSLSRPTRLPPAVQTGAVARSSFAVDGVAWEIRAASVIANGEPWLELVNGWPSAGASDAQVIEWPYPEPGPGMVPDDPARDFRWPRPQPPQVPNAALRLADVPLPDAMWSEITWFAAGFDGYEEFGGNRSSAK
jgi:hypothetical protein